jgi:hypothetical protein
MVGDVLFPVVKVRKQSDLYYEFGREHWLPEDEYRAPATPAIEIPGLTVSTSPYFAREYALAIPVADEERENTDSPMDPDRDGTELITNKLMLRREQRIQTLVTTTTNYATGFSTTLSGTSQWSDYVNSDPIGDVKTGIRKIHSSIFMEPNVGIFPYEVMSILEDHPDFIERIKYSQLGVLTADLIAALFGLAKIVVPGIGYDSSVPGAAASIGYLWGKDVVMAWTGPAGLKKPNFGYEFVWRYPGGQTQRVDRWREEARGADIIRVRRRYDLQLITVDGSGNSTAGDFLAGSKRSVRQDNIASLTDSSGGTASGTLAAITGGGAGCEDATKNAVASLAAKVEELTAALEAAGITIA